MSKRLIISCMKNEGPFILEWIAHHRAIGFDHFLIFTNDCTDGTDTLLDVLAGHGLVTRLDNPYQDMGDGYNPQKGALKYAEDLDLARNAEWILISDVDEFLNIHTGDGDLDALFAATKGADLISVQWRLFGNNGREAYEDVLLTEHHTRCAPTFCPNPIQAWGVKTLFNTRGGHVAGSYDKFGVHRPLKRRSKDMPHWVNGSGMRLTDDFADKGWRLGIRDHGYDLVSLNHYAVRSAQSFLVKRDRGRVNHVDRDQGLAYWLRMNFNMEQDRSILRRLPHTRAELARLHALPGVTSRHEACVDAHKNMIDELMTRDDMAAFFREITSPGLSLLSKHLNFLTRSQFSDGPDSIPDTLMAHLAQVPEL